MSGERLEVDPVSQNKSGFFGRPAKPVSILCATLRKGENQLLCLSCSVHSALVTMPELNRQKLVQSATKNRGGSRIFGRGGGGITKPDYANTHAWTQEGCG